MVNKQLRSRVADYIRKNENLKSLVIKGGTNGKSIDDYCNRIKTGKLQEDEIQIQALAMVCQLLIHVISMKNNLFGDDDIHISRYDAPVVPFKKCIYLYYDEEDKHYDSLYAINKENPMENITIFKYDDQHMYQLATRFVQEKLACDVDHQPDDESLVSSGTKIEHLATFAASTTSYDEPKKGFTIKRPSTLVPNEANNSNKRKKISTCDTFEMSTSNEPESIEEVSHIKNSSNGRQQLSNAEVEQENIRLEIELALEFRGRTLREFEPKKTEHHDGQPLKPGPPRYFPDKNNNNYLRLLLPNSFFSGDIRRHRLEICIVTPEINGYTYMNPYFNFRIHPTDRPNLLINPIYIYFNSQLKLEHYSESSRLLKLQFVVVMKTNNELMESEQPLRIFSSPQDNNHATQITTIFDKKQHEEFKAAYHLHGIRFAVTPWSRTGDNGEFCRHSDKQYISEISNEDKNAKVPKNTSNKKVKIYQQLCDSIFENVNNE
ncbi:unnamed protein product [Rotaria magnacalcarata]|uniref:Ubiquitin thioesterase OTU n=1 Tax=Rotaria magnacalcarata TaxID=392030 RepID=A0A814EMZ1_9BILA|nr:unnamed protein product [Rotaria magnacalcarata]CAF1257843.1 unnamed protein product [Rotaria magnacalcarata]CAF3901318.1 unnamed protein product [Rotaria magnacalcarata]CAF3928680.1 unnamed protein product [Rotaria magnacalcarata]